MRFRFKQFTLDTERFELLDEDVMLHVEPQVIELLALLIKNRSRLVTKEEINETVWKGRVVSDSALSSRIKTARQLVGDNGNKQDLIRTIHKKGFRFVAEAIELDTDSGRPELRKTKSSIQATHSDVYTTSNEHPAKPAVAVLPFSNLSNDTEQEYFSDGITTDIISHLSKHRWLDVTARNTAFSYKGKTLDARDIGRELNVSYIVEGTVQRAGNRIRVNVHLVDAINGLQKWADRYDRELSDIFNLQDEITEIIVARLEPEIGFSERNKVVNSRPANLDAWDCYHLGIYHFFKFTGSGNLESQRLLLKCQQLDGRFGEAYAWWAYAIILGMVYWDTKPSQTSLDKALAACDRALELDGQNATFYMLKARVLLARREYSHAIVENRNAIRFNPSLAAAYCGLGDSLAYEGRYDESIRYFDKAITLSPNDPQLWAFFTYGALVQLFRQDFDAALQWAERASSIPNCQYWTIAHRMVAYAYLGDRENIESSRTLLLKEQPGFSQAFAREKLFYLKKQEQIELYIEGLKLAGIPVD